MQLKNADSLRGLCGTIGMASDIFVIIGLYDVGGKNFFFILLSPLYNFLKEMPYEALWCIISLRTKTHERSDLIRQPYYTTTNT